jgi:hypothetical protein
MMEMHPTHTYHEQGRDRAGLRQQEAREETVQAQPSPARTPSGHALLSLQHMAGNRAVAQLMHGQFRGSPERSGAATGARVAKAQQGGPAARVRQAVRTTGQPLDANVQSEMEQHFDADFSQVRIHADGQPAESARDLGALAYTLGHDIVFAPGQYAARSRRGRHLLAHELAHVVQARGRTAATIVPSWRAGPWERQAEQAASSLGEARPYTLQTGAPPGLRMLPDPRLQQYLARIQELRQELPSILLAEAVAERLWSELQPLDLTNPDNLTPVMAAISMHFSEADLLAFLERVERATGRREPTPAEIAQHQRNIRVMQVQRRGPYGTVGPGVALPVIAGTVRPLYNIIQSLSAFFKGILSGIRAGLSPADYETLARKLGHSKILTFFAPMVIAAGAAVGIAEDIADAIRGVAEIVGNFREFVGTILEMISLMASDEGPVVARELGRATGERYAVRIRQLANLNLVRFTYELGRLVGPMVVYTVLSVVTAGAVAGAAVSTRLAALLTRVPRLARLLRSARARVRLLGRRRGARRVARTARRVISAAEVTEMRRLVRALREAIPAGPARDRSTVALALVEVDGRRAFAFAVNRNRFSRRRRGGQPHPINQRAEELGVLRIDAEPRTRTTSRAGRAEAAAPEDAEQILIEGAFTNDIDVIAILPSRPACRACASLIPQEGIVLVPP